MDRPLFSSLMQGHFSILKVLMHSESVTEESHQAEIERLVRRILKDLDNEAIEARQPIRDYLTLLGFGYLIEEQS